MSGRKRRLIAGLISRLLPLLPLLLLHLLQLLLQALLELSLLRFLLGSRLAVHRANVRGQRGDALRRDLLERGHHPASLHDHLRDLFIARLGLPCGIGKVGQLGGRLRSITHPGAAVTCSTRHLPERGGRARDRILARLLAHLGLARDALRVALLTRRLGVVGGRPFLCGDGPFTTSEHAGQREAENFPTDPH